VLNEDLDCSLEEGKGFYIDGVADITMDCNDYTIIGRNDIETGIYVQGSDPWVTGASIRNCQVKHWGVGIRFKFCNGFEIDNCVVMRNDEGISVKTSVGGAIRHVDASDNLYGIHLAYSENVLSSVVANANSLYNIYILEAGSKTGDGNRFYDVHACGAGQRDILLLGTNSAPNDTTNFVCNSVEYYDDDFTGTGTGTWECDVSCELWPALNLMEDLIEKLAEIDAKVQALESNVKVILDMIEKSNDEAACALLNSLLTHIDNAVKQGKLLQEDGDELIQITLSVIASIC
jgi:hypothetical protein